MKGTLISSLSISLVAVQSHKDDLQDPCLTLSASDNIIWWDCLSVTCICQAQKKYPCHCSRKKNKANKTHQPICFKSAFMLQMKWVHHVPLYPQRHKMQVACLSSPFDMVRRLHYAQGVHQADNYIQSI